MRCGEVPAPLLACVLVLDYYQPTSPAWPAPPIGALLVCDKCAFTIASCLERQTRMTPIVPGLPVEADGIWVRRRSVRCIACEEHPPCRCGAAT